MRPSYWGYATGKGRRNFFDPEGDQVPVMEALERGSEGTSGLVYQGANEFTGILEAIDVDPHVLVTTGAHGKAQLHVTAHEGRRILTHEATGLRGMLFTHVADIAPLVEEVKQMDGVAWVHHAREHRPGEPRRLVPGQTVGSIDARSSTMGTPERVAARYIIRLSSYRTRIAAQIPGAWFKGRASELKALLRKPLDEGLQHWSGQAETSLTEFFDAFERDFARVAPTHADAVSPAVRAAKRDLRQSLIPWWNLESFRAQHVFNPDGRGVSELLRHAAGWACVDRVESAVKTVGDLFKTTFSVPDGAVARAAEKVLTRASPADSPRDLVTAVKALAPKAVVKVKATWSPVGWVDTIFDSLSKAWAPEPFATFDVGGLRVVFEGSVAEKETEQYMAHVLEAYRALGAKRLKKAWYGELFICPGCENAGGAYRAGPDTVSLYEKPGARAVYAIVHEVGHRYWFKSMSSAQRARFQTLVKAHTVEQPPGAPSLFQVMRFTDRDIQSGHRAIDRFVSRFHPLIDALESSSSPDGILRGMQDAVKSLEKDLRRFTSLVGNSKILSEPAMNLHNNYSLPLSKARQGLEEAIHRGDQAAIDRFSSEVTTAAHTWVDAAARAFNAVADDQLEGLDRGREWLDSYLHNTAPVVPVSAYGKTNIDEAFAEVFAHYVLEFDITRDQLESFATVFER